MSKWADIADLTFLRTFFLSFKNIFSNLLKYHCCKIAKTIIVVIVAIIAITSVEQEINLLENQVYTYRRARLEYSVVQELENEEVRDFVRDTIVFYYSKHDFSKGVVEVLVNRILGGLIEREVNDKEAAEGVWEKIGKPWSAGNVIREALVEYRKGTKVKIQLGLLMAHNDSWGARIVDLGAGDNRLAYEMDKNFGKEVREIIGVDINDYTGERVVDSEDRERVSFILQEDERKLPNEIESSSVDAVVATAVLHHMSTDIRDAIIKEVYRVLKPGGRWVILEDTFPESEDFKPEGKFNAELTDRFLKLSLEQKMAVTKFLDWYGNYFSLKHENTPLPYNFQTIESWENIFQEAGFNVESSTYLDVVDESFSQRSPLGVFVLEKLQNVALNKDFITVTEDMEEMSRVAIDLLMNRLREIVKEKGEASIRLPGGRTYDRIYEILAEEYSDDPIWSNVILVQLDEYIGSNMLRDELQKKLIEPLGFKDFISIDGRAKDIDAELDRVNEELEGGIDLVFLGLGENGALALNEPDSDVLASDRSVDIVDLEDYTLGDKGIFFSRAFTPTLRLIQETAEVFLLASGETGSNNSNNKKEIIERALLGNITPSVPISYIRLHPNATIILDRAAVSERLQGVL
ncbi:MAG: methyltransferase domain-containing protein [Candidatus Kaelpia imicola]|nr:methyltransferase domain-containing protein [Candidatus Kaelpia imicola]